MPSIPLHNCKAGNVSRPIPYVDHVFKRNRSQLRWHVIIHIIPMLEHSLVDSKQKLRLRGMGNRPLWKADLSLMIFPELTAEYRGHMFRQTAALKQSPETRGNNEMFNFHAYRMMLRPQDD